MSASIQILFADLIYCGLQVYIPDKIYPGHELYNILQQSIIKHSIYDLCWNHLTRNILFYNCINDVKFSLAKERYLWRLVKSAWELLCLQKGLSQNFVKMMNRYQTIWNISNAVFYRWAILLSQAWVTKIFRFLVYCSCLYLLI